MPDSTLWQTLANFGFPALVAGFVLWRVDAKLGQLLERMTVITVLLLRSSSLEQSDKEQLLGMMSRKDQSSTLPFT